MTTTYEFKRFLVNDVSQGEGVNPIAISLASNLTVIAVYEALDAAKGIVQGYIYDASNNAPIAGASATLGQYSATSGGNGFFSFPSVIVGNYTLTVTAIGYQTKSITPVSVASDQTTTQDVHLDAQSIGGCYIATAAFGTPMAPELNVLRWFRDTKLPEKITLLYYRTSPPIANAIRKRDNTRTLIRGLLKPIIMLLEKIR